MRPDNSEELATILTLISSTNNLPEMEKQKYN